MKCIGVIPVRMASTRFPGKPLVPLLGLPMVEHVRRRSLFCRTLDEVIVATCDEEIRRVVNGYGGKVIMTSKAHERCTDRIAEAVRQVDGDIVVNIQGDEPLVVPRMIDEVLQPMLDDPMLPSTNLMMRIVDEQEFHNKNVVKVVTSLSGEMLYCSREPIPSVAKAQMDDYRKLKQLGIIAFRKDFLQTFAHLPPTPLEIIESVDMMRAVEHGYRVKMVETEGVMVGVDMPGDVVLAEKALLKDSMVADYA